MLKKIRTALAVLSITGITLLLLDVTGALHGWLGWMAKIQFLPAILAANIAIVAVLLIATLLLGRVYCSVICPLGIYQDVVNRISSSRKGKKNRFSWKPERKWLRYTVLAVFVLAIFFGIQTLVAVLEPYSAYGRMVRSLLAPVYGWGNNLFAVMAERAGSYAFYSTPVKAASLPVLGVAVLTLAVVTVMAWKGGRSYCNSICPVGTLLSAVSRFSIFRPVIDTEKCRNCKLCEKRCKASCIDIASHKIDYSRCVDCFDCVDNCKFGALHYKLAWGASGKAEKSAGTSPKGASRRDFLAITALAGAGAVKAQAQKKRDGGFAEILPKTAPERTTPLTPPGSISPRHFYDRCTACQLCVATCPNDVLRPSSSLERLMQPEMSYEKGYCRPECTECSQVCPAGAILPITPEQKTAIKIGTASVDRSLCVVERDGVRCGNCARHCPAGAIRMVLSDPEDPDSLRIPSVDTERCIGCGACENLCPARPLSAITVNGVNTHITA